MTSRLIVPTHEVVNAANRERRNIQYSIPLEKLFEMTDDQIEREGRRFAQALRRERDIVRAGGR